MAKKVTVDKRVDKTRDSIQSAFIQLMTKRKVDRISVTELCQAANISRSTFYDHYRNTDDCLDEILMGVMNGFEDSLPKAERITNKEFTRRFLNYFNQHQDYYEPFMLLLLYLPTQNTVGDRVLDTFLKEAAVYFSDYEDTELYRIRLRYQFFGVISLMLFWRKKKKELPVDIVIQALFPDKYV